MNKNILNKFNEAKETLQRVLRVGKQKTFEKPPEIKSHKTPLVQEVVGEKIAEALDFSGKEGRDSQREMIRYMSELQRENERLKRNGTNNDGNSRVSWLVLAVSLATWGVVLGWTGATIYWQASPESSVQEFTSSLVEKGLNWDEKTTYQLIGERKEMVIKIKELQSQVEDMLIKNSLLREENANLKKNVEKLKEDLEVLMRIATVFEILHGNDINAIHEELRKKIEAINRVIRKKSEVINNVARRQWQPQVQDGQKPSEEKALAEDNAKIYATVKKVSAEVMGDFADKGAEIKITEYCGGNICVWVQYKGKKSLGFYANNAKNQHRLTKEGLKSWTQSSLDQLLLVEQIESAALSKGIGTSTEGFVSMKTEKLYSGNVKVIFSDSLSKKTGQFIVDIKKDKQEDIPEKIEKILGDFLSQKTKETPQEWIIETSLS